MSENTFLDRALDKLDSIDKNIDGINITLAKQEVSLAEHIKRSNNIEELVNLHKKETLVLENRFETMHDLNLRRIEKLEQPVSLKDFMKHFFWIGGGLATIVGALVAAYEMFKK